MQPGSGPLILEKDLSLGAVGNTWGLLTPSPTVACKGLGSFSKALQGPSSPNSPIPYTGYRGFCCHDPLPAEEETKAQGWEHFQGPSHQARLS